ncbi:hypothetical protein BH11PLA1_BH11PLA1_03360 [soil metagenome]
MAASKSGSKKSGSSKSPSAQSASPKGGAAGKSKGSQSSSGEQSLSKHPIGKILVEQMRDLLFAEKALIAALPKMSKKATNDALVEAIDGHLEETHGHVERLEEAFELLGLKAKAQTCPAIQGIVEEAKELMDEMNEDENQLDAAICTGGRKAEHYEIGSYGTIIEFAKSLGFDDVADLLQQTLDEEIAADEKLHDLAAEIAAAAGPFEGASAGHSSSGAGGKSPRGSGSGGGRFDREVEAKPRGGAGFARSGAGRGNGSDSSAGTGNGGEGRRSEDDNE